VLDTHAPPGRTLATIKHKNWSIDVSKKISNPTPLYMIKPILPLFILE
jgi:hypothetical protein